LKLPEEWTRLQAKQVLKAKGAKEVIACIAKMGSCSGQK
jgi:hypothetical protein